MNNNMEVQTLNIKDKLVTWLFETKALRVCEEGKPFWYTSGTIGPYYINTHFLYGNEEKATALLELMEEQRENPKMLLNCLYDSIAQNFATDKIFYNLIHALRDRLLHDVNVEEIDAISGGERRDWFFSVMLAELLNKPHIYIFKDQSTFIQKGKTSKVASLEDINDMNVCHVADLINEGSSYARAWVPAIKQLGAKIKWSATVVDRNQGGEEVLAKLGVKSISLLDISEEMFKTAQRLNYISEKQLNLILNYITDPKASMANFLKHNPGFIKDSLEGDERTKQRANLCINNKIYGDIL